MITSRFSETDTASKAFFHNLSRFYERTGPGSNTRQEQQSRGGCVHGNTPAYKHTLICALLPLHQTCCDVLRVLLQHMCLLHKALITEHNLPLYFFHNPLIDKLTEYTEVNGGFSAVSELLVK